MRRTARTRRALIAFVLGGSLVLSGCGPHWGDDAGGTVDGSITLGFVNGGSTRFHRCLQKAVEETAANYLTVIHTAESRQDATTELANIEDMIARNVDALIVQTVDVDALKDDIAKAKEAGVPIFLTSIVPDNTSDILGAVVVDLEKVGALDARWIERDAAGADVRVGIVAGVPGAASDLLVGGFTGALPDNAMVVASRPGMFDAAKARKVAESMIKTYPDLDYAFVANEEMAFASGRPSTRPVRKASGS